MQPPVINQEDIKRAMLQEAIATLGKLLPMGMTVSFYRNPDDPRTIVESKYPDGEVTHGYFTNAMH